MMMIRKMYFAIIVVLLPLAGTSAQETFNLDSLLAASVGGPPAVAKLRDVTTMYAGGSVSLNGLPGRFESYVVVPDRIYLKVDLGTFAVTQAFDGEAAWQQDQNGMVSELSGFEKRSLLSQLYLQTYSFLFPDRLPGRAEYRGLAERDGALCHEVAFFPFQADTIYAFFDQRTGYQTAAVIYLDNLETVTTSGDYRVVDSVAVAFYSRSTTTGAPLFVEMQVDTLAFEAAVDPGVFRRPDMAADYRFPTGRDSVIVPISFTAGHIYVPATINGVRKVRMILDSGASTNLFDSHAVADLGLEVVGDVIAKGLAGYDKVNLVRSDSLLVGDLVLLRQVAGTADLSGLQRPDIEGEPFGGLLGYDFMSRFPVLIDYHAQQLTVYDPERFTAPAGGSEVPFELTMQVPTIEAELVGIRGKFLLDLGNVFGLIIHPGFSEAHNLLQRLDDVAEIETGLAGVGGGLSGRSGYAASFAFGDVRIHSLRVLLPESSAGLSGSRELAGNIGNLVLQQFRILFDYRRQRVIFYETPAGAR